MVNHSIYPCCEQFGTAHEHRSTRGALSRALGTHVLAGLAIASLVVGLVLVLGQVKATSSAPSTHTTTLKVVRS